MDELPVTDRTRIHRRPQRAHTDRALLDAILDEAPLVHVGFVVDGQPVVIPTTHVRVGRTLYIHGAPANRMLRIGAGGAELCATVTILDGLVLARSAFHHSMNYRSVVIFGRAHAVTDAAEKQRVLAALVDRMVPGRSGAARAPTAAELAATLLLALPIEEASVKVRSGPCIDDEADLAWPAWAGVIPVALRAGVPVADVASPSPSPSTTTSPSGPIFSAPRESCAGPPERAEARAVTEARHAAYRIDDDRGRVDLGRVTAWLAGEYWAPGIPRWAVERSAARSALVAAAYAGDGQQVGFLRVVSDCTRFAYLMDVFVAPAHRGRGLGRALVRFALAHPDLRDVSGWLLGTRDAHGVYAADGFRPLAAPERFMQRVGPPPWSRG